MSAFVLKLIAILAMVIDHLAAVFLSQQKYPELYFVLRAIGKLTMPIMCYFMAEGFHHTRSVPKYLVRLGFFAILAAYPFKALFGTPYDVMVTFMLALGVLEGCRHARNNFWIALAVGVAGLFFQYTVTGSMEAMHETTSVFVVLVALSCIPRLNGLMSEWLVVGAGGLVAFTLGSDWSFMGVLMVYAFEKLRTKPKAIWAGGMAAVFIAMVTLYLFQAVHETPSFFFSYMLPKNGYLYAVLFSLPLLALYNGKRGPRLRYLFYIFYPAHLWVIYIVRYFHLL